MDSESKTAYGKVNWWNEGVAGSENLDWGDVFPSIEAPSGLYRLVHEKAGYSPENDALKHVAQKYALTTADAKKVLSGSITPFFNNPKTRSAKLTQETAFQLVNNLQKDYDALKEVFDLEAEIDLAVGPSEIFSNGELMDSGFDLIHDLTIMEEVLFLEKTQNQVGEDFGGGPDSPVSPVLADQTIDNYIEDSNDVAVTDIGVSSFPLESDSGSGDLGPLSDEDVEVLTEDICPDDSPYADILDAYEEENGGGDNDGGDGDGNGGDDGGGDGNGNDDGEEDPDKKDDEPAALEPPPKEEWLSQWCPGIEDGGNKSGDFGMAGFSSLGGIQGAVAGEEASSGGITVKAAVCINLEIIWKHVSTFSPGQSCVLCEISRINDFMNKTLTHSLIPNKATGNLMESAKCKDAFNTPLLNMQVIIIPSPVPSPPNDDLILGNNVFEEWKKYVDKYQPFMFGDDPYKTKSDQKADVQVGLMEPGATTEDLYTSIKATMLKEESKALIQIEADKTGADAANVTEYIQVFLTEINEMMGFFKGYNEQYIKVGEYADKILGKSTCS